MSQMRKSPRGILCLGMVLLGGLMAGGTVRAADLGKIDSSLKLIPANAAFYSTSLNNREQFAIIADSKAWAKLKALPAVQTFWKKVQEDLVKKGGALEQYREFTQDPANSQLVELLGDMLAHEFFVYGGENFGDILDVWMQTWLPLKLNKGFSRFAGRDPNEAQLEAILEVLVENVDRLQVPDLILGFKLSKTERALAQMRRLEKLLKVATDGAPLLKGRVKTAKVAGSDFLTFTFDGDMVPWEKGLERFEEVKDIDKLIKKLKGLKLTFSLGVRDQYLLFSIGASTAQAAQLGQGPTLADRADLKPLSQHADKRILEISYVSQAFLSKVSMSKKDVEELFEQGKTALKDANLPDELSKRLEKDLNELSKDIQGYITLPGSQVSISFLTADGMESYAYDNGEHPALDGSKPLSLLHHVGGSPLLFAVDRFKYRPEGYQRLVKWIKIGHGYIEDFAVPFLNEERKKHYEDLTHMFYPLIKRLDEVTSKMFLPALADGQSGFVLDAKWSSKQWFPRMPATARAMPMPELAIVLGVSDAELLKKALASYREVVNDALAKVHKISEGAVPEATLPAPLRKQTKAGEIFYYQIPAMNGLDKRILPNAGLADKVAVISLSQGHSERILTRTPLRIDGWNAGDKPLACFVHFNWAGTIEAFTPWIELGVETIARTQLGVKDAQETAEILKQARDVLEVLKVFRGATTVMYFEEKMLVTHTKTIFRDVK